MWQNSYDGSPSLYLVPTPIGNMEDITLRAIKILKEVDVIFAEDTRVTLQLLNYFDIKNRVISLHNYNEDKVRDVVLDFLVNKKNVAIVTDRGTPLISDPGYKTVKYIKDHGYNVIALPGACAMIPAMIASGISSVHFLFYGFLDSRDSAMVKELSLLSSCDYPIIFYEAPHRLIKTLKNMLSVFGNRNISISKEISKLHEMIFTGTLEEAISLIKDVKGEFVVVVDKSCDVDNNNDIDIMVSISMYVKSGLSIMDSIKRVARDKGMSKSDVYKYYIERKK